LYLSFLYHKIEYSGIALGLIHSNHNPRLREYEIYLLYIDTNSYPRLTKLKHLKKIKNRRNEDVAPEFLIKKLDKYETKLNLFSFEGRKFLDSIKIKYKKMLDDFEKKRYEDENFSLRKYARE